MDRRSHLSGISAMSAGTLAYDSDDMQFANLPGSAEPIDIMQILDDWFDGCATSNLRTGDLRSPGNSSRYAGDSILRDRASGIFQSSATPSVASESAGQAQVSPGGDRLGTVPQKLGRGASARWIAEERGEAEPGEVVTAEQADFRGREHGRIQSGEGSSFGQLSRAPPGSSKEELEKLLNAGEGPLRDLVTRLFSVLAGAGLQVEAAKAVDQVATQLSAMAALGSRDRPELRGMDALLKDGLLEYLRAVEPHLPPLPIQIVTFQNISFSVRATRAGSTIPNFLTAGPLLLKRLLVPHKAETLELLKGVTGYMMPGSLTLVLGPTGCGKSTLENVLSGRATMTGGSVTYNGKPASKANLQRLASVSFQRDAHLALLTVRETLHFARDCSNAVNPKSPHFGVGLRRFLKQAFDEGEDPILESRLAMLGLRRAADRAVGSAESPTLSPDEVRRLTAAEIMVGQYSVLFFDQISRKLDGKSTYDVVSMLRIFARVRQISAAVALLHPVQEVYDLFDRVLLLARGQVLFQGPCRDAVSHFLRLGYRKPALVAVPDFLQEVTTDGGRQYLQPGLVPLSFDEFVAAYEKSAHCRDVLRVVDTSPPLQEYWIKGCIPTASLAVQLSPSSPPIPAQELTTSSASLHLPVTQILNGLNGNPEAATASSARLVVTRQLSGCESRSEMQNTAELHPGDIITGIRVGGREMEYCQHVGGTLTAGSVLEVLENGGEDVLVQLQRSQTPVATGLLARESQRPYILDFWPELKLLLGRQQKLILRNRFLVAARLVQIVVMSLFNAANLFQMPRNRILADMNLRRAVIFATLVTLTSVNVGQLPALLEEKRVYVKQARNALFRPATFLLAQILAGLPFSMAEALIWSVLVYFISGLSNSEGGWHFWLWLAVAELTAVHGASMVRFYAFAISSPASTNFAVALTIPFFILFAHFLIPLGQVPAYWLWAYYVDPLQWGSTIISVSEFRSATYAHHVCGDNLQLFFCKLAPPEEAVGAAYLRAYGWHTGWWVVPVGFAVILLWIATWNFGTLFCLQPQYLRRVVASESRQNSPSSEAEARFESSQVEKEDEDWRAGSLGRPAGRSTPVEAQLLSWHSLSYELLPPGGAAGRALLSDISGWACPGEVLAIAGGTSSGKTTLLNCLAGRKIPGRLGGQVLVNGRPRQMASFQSVTGYVESLEVHPPYLTVRESLMYRAAMSAPRHISRSKRAALVMEILECLELRHLAGFLVGTLATGGAVPRDTAKRMEVALELAINPTILFVNSPFHSLDVLQATNLSQCFQHVASMMGCTVILTSIAPTAAMLNAMASILVLKRGGTQVFFGSPGLYGQDIVSFFEAIPGTPPAPESMLPVSYVVNVIGDGTMDRRSLRDYSYEYRISQLALSNARHLVTLRQHVSAVAPPGSSTPTAGWDGTAPYLRKAAQVVLLLQRQHWRNAGYSFQRLLFACLLALLMGSLYFQQPLDTFAGMSSCSAFVFALCIFGATANAGPAAALVANFRRVQHHERTIRMYPVLLYSLAYTLSEIPTLSATTLAMCGISCSMAGVAVGSAAQFLQFWFTLFLLALAVTYAGLLAAVALPSFKVASVAVPMVVGAWITLSGYIIPRSRVVSLFWWLYWTNPLQYALNTLTSIVFFCDTTSSACRLPGCATSAAACPACTCPRLKDALGAFVWDNIKDSRSLEVERKVLDWLFLLLFCLGCRILTFCSLSYLRHNRTISS